MDKSPFGEPMRSLAPAAKITSGNRPCLAFMVQLEELRGGADRYFFRRFAENADADRTMDPIDLVGSRTGRCEAHFKPFPFRLAAYQTDETRRMVDNIL